MPLFPLLCKEGLGEVESFLLGLESVELGRELRNTSGSGIPMEGAFGHGLVKGRGGFPEKGLSRFRILFLQSGFKFLHHRLGAMQDRVVPRVTLLRLTGTFNG